MGAGIAILIVLAAIGLITALNMRSAIRAARRHADSAWPVDPATGHPDVRERGPGRHGDHLDGGSGGGHHGGGHFGGGGDSGGHHGGGGGDAGGGHHG